MSSSGASEEWLQAVDHALDSNGLYKLIELGGSFPSAGEAILGRVRSRHGPLRHNNPMKQLEPPVRTYIAILLHTNPCEDRTYMSSVRQLIGFGENSLSSDITQYLRCVCLIADPPGGAFLRLETAENSPGPVSPRQAVRLGPGASITVEATHECRGDSKCSRSHEDPPDEAWELRFEVTTLSGRVRWIVFEPYVASLRRWQRLVANGGTFRVNRLNMPYIFLEWDEEIKIVRPSKLPGNIIYVEIGPDHPSAITGDPVEIWEIDLAVMGPLLAGALKTAKKRKYKFGKHLSGL